MEIHSNGRHLRSIPQTPKCVLISKTIKKTLLPYYSTFGAFPDETLTTSLDKLLYFLGVRKMQRYFNLQTPSQEIIEDDCDITVKPNECCTENSFRLTNVRMAECRPYKSICPKYNNTSFRSINYHRCSPASRKVDTFIPYRGKNVNIMKRSFSLCSLACRKMKEKFFCGTKPNAPRWLWTKLQSQNNGCQVYEVYKNSTVSSHPTHFDTCAAARIIFIILPSGIIMPFETLPSH